VDAGSAAPARNAFWGERGGCGCSGPKTHFGVDAGFAAAAVQKRILEWTRGLRHQRSKNAFWSGRWVCGSSDPKTHFGVDAGSVAAAAAAAGDEKKYHVECLREWR